MRETGEGVVGIRTAIEILAATNPSPASQGLGTLSLWERDALTGPHNKAAEVDTLGPLIVLPLAA